MKKKVFKIVLALVLCPLAMFLFSLTLPKRYTASTSLLVTPAVRYGGVPGRMDKAIDDMLSTTAPRSIPTMLDMLYSSDVLLEAIRRTAEQHPNAFTDSEQAGSRYASLVNRLRVDNNKDSEVLNVRITMDDPQIAADTANNIAYALNDMTKRKAKEVGLKVVERIDGQIKKTKDELAVVDRRMKELVSQTGIGDLAARTAFDDKAVAELRMQIDSVEAQYTGAAGELAAARQVLARTPKHIRTNTTVARPPMLDNLDAEIARADSDLAALRQKFTESHPSVQQMAFKVAELKNRRAAQPSVVTAQSNTSLNPNYTAAEAAVATAQTKVSSLGNSLGTMRAQLSKTEATMARYPALKEQYDKLLRDQMHLTQSLMAWTQKREALAVNDDAASEAPVQIVSTAFPPSRPSFPNTKLFVLMGLAVGIVLSALIVMPKAPEVVYTPLPSEALALDPAMRGVDGLTAGEAQRVPAPAIESGSPK